MQAEDFQRKLEEKNKVYNQNRDLVTKNCAQQSVIDRLKKEVKEKNDKIEDLQTEI